MSLVFKIGEHKDMLPVPFNFPRCGNFVPNTWNGTTSNDCDKLNFFTSMLQSWMPNIYNDYCAKSRSNIVTVQISLFTFWLLLMLL